MLKQLYIKNYTLIDLLDIEFYPGFSVITGETGAGKSIILGAIGLLLGQRADSKDIKTGTDRCQIEARFDLSRYDMESFFQENDLDYDAQDCIIRRELLSSGKSRAFINDTPVSLALLKELGEQLVDVHSQHQNLLLNKQDFQLNVVDIIAGKPKELATYQTEFANFLALQHQLTELREEIERNKNNADFLQFQYDELSQARLSAGEQEELEQRQDTMSHAEDIKSALYQTDHALTAENTGIVEQLKTAIQALQSIDKVLPATQELSRRMDSCYIDLKDMSQDIGSMLDHVDFDPAELDAVNSRLDTIYHLQKKYHCESVEVLLQQQQKLKEQLAAIENADDTLTELQQKTDKQQERCKGYADKLTMIRKKAAQQIENQMSERLKTLGMPNVRFQVVVEQTTLNRSGQDKVSFLFSANTSTPLHPIAQVASGGEIARVMLALKVMISGAVKLPTIIFDEIDTGVSGKIAESMAHMMNEMGAGGRQVISITHLPQIAALGAHHYKVYKEESDSGTASHMLLLNDEERVREIAQMLSGSDITEAAINNAKELLKQ
ncbi:MAG: DNA repair protein RecN [Prevotella sp.]|nr:DNA repair protein RecN [Prevotella sp.]